jgi:protein TonB
MFNRFALGFLGLALAATTLQPASAAASRATACASADVDARLARPANPVRPTLAVAQGATGTALVEIKLSPSGTVLAARVAKSTGNAALDRAALEAARQSTFAPAIHQCEPTGGSYRLSVEFTD